MKSEANPKTCLASDEFSPHTFSFLMQAQEILVRLTRMMEHKNSSHVGI
jgi:hypothetical protein